MNSKLLLTIGKYLIGTSQFLQTPLYAILERPNISRLRLDRLIHLSTSICISAVRCGEGIFSAREIENAPRPRQALHLYEYENSPFCRLVREQMCTLELDAFVNPCPRETFRKAGTMVHSRFRPDVLALGGKLSFPCLVDPNTGTTMYESRDIVEYLWKTYGYGARPPRTPLSFVGPNLQLLNSFVTSVFRPCHGMLRIPSKSPKRPLVLWSYESHPSCRLVREALSQLELPYMLHNTPLGSVRMAKFRATKGVQRLPFLEDPNTGFHSDDWKKCVNYLMETYKAGEAPKESYFEFGKDDE